MNLSEVSMQRLVDAKQRKQQFDRSNPPVHVSLGRLKARETELSEILSKMMENHLTFRGQQTDLFGSHKSMEGLEAHLGDITKVTKTTEAQISTLEIEKRRLIEKVNADKEKNRVAEQEERRLAAQLAEMESFAAKAESSLRKLKEKLNQQHGPCLAESDLSKLFGAKSSELDSLRSQLQDLSMNNPQLHASLNSAVRSLLTAVLTELNRIHEHQAAVCDRKMELLSQAMDREEKLLSIMRRRRQIGELDHRREENCEGMRLDEIEGQQEMLVALHAALKSANEKRNAVAVRAAELEERRTRMK